MIIFNFAGRGNLRYEDGQSFLPVALNLGLFAAICLERARAAILEQLRSQFLPFSASPVRGARYMNDCSYIVDFND
ncbi:MAG: hypothetical protein OP8BY_2103 [Candidatus Saccharicenans subterraneus]|uniref:Uncharacterized protein n=1 Tax=Candidatus Saccharicenans subterraneus TaxID=2508984 RepID=A0A3E2BN75_9BACT|nr:MAG: hypothetical protein OP8BY_2103 [Candidatus Saccharicenans subterraneum]